MIIVEGPDGSGKSTLIEKLGYERRAFRALRAKQDDGAGAQNWAGKDEAPIAYARQVLAALDEEKMRAGHVRHAGSPPGAAQIAFDRFHLSEVVYGPLLRGGSGISDEEVLVLERLLAARGVPVVLCLPPGVVALKNVTQAGRERPPYQTLGFLRRAYRAWDGLPRDRYGLRVDYTALHDVAAFVRAGVRLLGMGTCPPSVVGSPGARFLVVGERSTVPLDLPFFSMRGSAGYLNRALWYAGFREEEIALTNAYASDGRPRDLRACLLASTTAVISLGLEADRALTEQGIPETVPVFHAPHPQFWKRFHASHPEQYVNALRQIREAALEIA